MTLLEVLAALAILGIVLVSVWMSHGRSTRQWANARHRQQAIRLADQLLTTWWSDPDGDGIPIDASGLVDHARDWSWTTQRLELDSQEVKPLGLYKVVLKIAHISAPQKTMAHIELVLPILKQPEPES